MPSAALTERRSRAVARGPRDPASNSDDDEGGDRGSGQLPAMDPKWKLDRRASGHLFWRRDSAAFPDNASRVKFRYDVQVVEYEDAAAADGQAALLPADEAEEGDVTASDSEESSSSSSGAEGPTLDRSEQRALRRRRRAKAGSRRRLSDTSTAAAASSSVLVCFLCVAVIVITMSYQWLLVE
ncbi:uncharacterized protein LOC126346910 [Schistocerca gregaria]|uniref:uncharacterized protein LOC126346910 n=1 Tax=Schistocerca gregaria TaxID=7010 RepID=UPI00211E1EBF|nr:uncharacterized protein LOC126346910 [Schistocerca gregaria]